MVAMRGSEDRALAGRRRVQQLFPGRVVIVDLNHEPRVLWYVVVQLDGEQVSASGPDLDDVLVRLQLRVAEARLQQNAQ
jgi:hypothetical protein